MHTTTTSQTTKPSKNPLCCELGHDWKLTPSGTFRACGRDYCPAIERLVDGAWYNARPSRKSLRAHVSLVGKHLRGGRA